MRPRPPKSGAGDSLPENWCLVTSRSPLFDGGACLGWTPAGLRRAYSHEPTRKTCIARCSMANASEHRDLIGPWCRRALPVHPSGSSHRVLASRPASRPLRDIEPALHRRPRQAALQPGRDVGEFVEGDEIARAIEPDQIAHPAEHGNIRDRVVVVHDPSPPGKPPLDHGEQTFGFGDIALQGTLVGDLLAGEFVKEADL